MYTLPTPPLPLPLLHHYHYHPLLLLLKRRRCPIWWGSHFPTSPSLSFYLIYLVYLSITPLKHLLITPSGGDAGGEEDSKGVLVGGGRDLYEG